MRDSSSKNGRESHKTRVLRKNFVAALDRAAVLTTILSNGECGCRGEDGNQLRLNASANLERPVQKPAFRFLGRKKVQAGLATEGAKSQNREMISVAEAIQIVRQQTQALSTERVPLEQALGRVLAEDVIADTDLPPFDRAQMDGYAVRAQDVKEAPVRLRITGESAAGRGWHHELEEGQAVRIMTGAPVPAGADSVQQVELTHELKDGTVVELLESVEFGRSIVARGAEIKAGEIVASA